MTAPTPPATAKAQAQPRSAYRVFRTIATRWMDNDVYGHVNNVVYYSWFDTAVNAWLIEQGLPEECDCSFSIASISHFGPVATPMRNPVIAWLFDTPETVRMRVAMRLVPPSLSVAVAEIV